MDVSGRFEGDAEEMLKLLLGDRCEDWRGGRCKGAQQESACTFVMVLGFSSF